MAWRAGCKVNHLEFNQFHPTCLYYSGEKPFLISEVLRGEGGKLISKNGERFIKKYDEREELAPRDIVARAIHNELHKNEDDCVYLDITHLPSTMIQSSFPTIYHYCYQHGIDITRQPIPVVPAAHYTCGGVVTNLQGQTNLPHLYAIGEAACTGLHGANRMASNSLLECLVFAMSAGKAIQHSLENDSYVTEKARTEIMNPSKSTYNFEQHQAAIRQLMWDKVGIVRNNQGLREAESTIKNILNELNSEFLRQKLTREFIEFRNLVHSAHLIVKSAIARKENCGLHYNTDLSPDIRASVSNEKIT